MLFEHPTGDTRPPSQTVIEAIASAEGVEPADLSQPLYDVIDPEALDELFQPSVTRTPATGAVTFHYHGYEVTVDSTGSVELRPLDED